jgi:hypothetical protein
MTEARIQQECFQWHWNTYPNDRKRLFLIHNTPKNAIDGARLRGMGMVAGVSDLIYLRDGLPPLCIEMKDATGKQSPAQIAWQKIAEDAGCTYVIIRSLAEFQELFNGEG